MSRQVGKAGLAQVVHALTDPRFGVCFDNVEWMELAKPVVALGGDWPAALALAAMTSIRRPSVDQAVRHLRVQSGQDMGALPAPGFWDAVCGLVGRSWRLGILDEFTATVRLDRVWWHIRDHEPQDRAEELIWEGMACFELDHFVDMDMTNRALALLVEADQLIPDNAVDTAFCETVLETFL
ncbi:hypothetical protein [Nocardia huaxiensis]|uniref:Uncharacterized protein n=1 Tax=Nocardia huaxiensis TaxID=2755382 RepID=A0A7D6ZHN2_9NOCA|nr:hypothetical protein [Nocardia huaxiensis]QLY31179.1 hypothetical protein H0264_01955 [Nocardia huaxiensis]UFS94708.1 hypothetical protein LPY97_28800 [Nocardia huaxiensis]